MMTPQALSEDTYLSSTIVFKPKFLVTFEGKRAISPLQVSKNLNTIFVDQQVAYRVDNEMCREGYLIERVQGFSVEADDGSQAIYLLAGESRLIVLRVTPRMPAVATEAPTAFSACFAPQEGAALTTMTLWLIDA